MTDEEILKKSIEKAISKGFAGSKGDWVIVTKPLEYNGTKFLGY